MKKYFICFFLITMLCTSFKVLQSGDQLRFINQINTLTFIYQDYKCGEWGGDIETVKIYRLGFKGDIYADYLLETLDCEDLDSRKRQITNSKKKIKLSEDDKDRVVESISQLMKGRLNKEDSPAHAGYNCSAALSDSSIVIENFTFIKWSKFELFRTGILKK